MNFSSKFYLSGPTILVSPEVMIKIATAIVNSNEMDFEGQIHWDTSKPDGTPRKLLDVSKINKLGWVASTDIKKGIKKTISFFDHDFINKKPV